MSGPNHNQAGTCAHDWHPLMFGERECLRCGTVDVVHDIDVRFDHVRGEHLPSCSCGWVGAYTSKSLRAEHEAAQHEARREVSS